MDFKAILYEKRDKIAYITLNRPDKLNSLSAAMFQELNQAWEDFKGDAGRWVAVLTGAGDKAFCGGIADYKDMMGPSGAVMRRPEEFRWTARHLDIWKPVITAVNGICAGGGFHFIADSDIVICSDNATFYDPHGETGTVAAWEPIGLSRRIPLGEVLRMVLLGSSEVMTAQRAYEIGLVSEVVPLAQLQSRARQLAEMVAEKAPLAVQGTLEAVWRGLNVGLHSALIQGHYILTNNWSTEDIKEGIRAFSQKRRPRWQGR